MIEDNISIQKNDLEQLAKGKRSSLAGEFVVFLKHNKKWWLLPIILILLGLGMLVLLSSSALAPFIYPLF
jgi:hypothetical protein